jgi:hypothetical protein
MLLPAYIGDVRAWKADDAAETTIILAKNPAVDADDQSVYAATKAQLLAGQLVYLGTTVLGKDGGPQPIVFNDGTTVVLNPEAPAAGMSGSYAALYAVVLAHRLGAEPAAAGSGSDPWLRARVSAFMAALRDLAARFV